MPLTKEEINQIAEATANKVVAKSKENPTKEPMFSMCSCGEAAVNMVFQVHEALREYTKRQEISPWAKERLGLLFRELEARCPADMAKVDDVVKKIQKTGEVLEEDIHEIEEGMSRAFFSCMKEAVKE